MKVNLIKLNKTVKYNSMKLKKGHFDNYEMEHNKKI